MKRLFSLLAAMVLMVSCAWAENAAGTAKDTREAGLLDLWLTDGESRTWITAAPQMMDGLLLTSPALLPENIDSLSVSDGENEWKVEAVIPDSAGLMAMVFFNADRQQSRWGFWPLMPYGDSAKASESFVRFGTADGGRTDSRVLSAGTLKWNNKRCLLLDMETEVPAGAAVINAKGEMSGLVIADYAEGQRRVLALPVDEIVSGLTEAGTLLDNLPSWGEPPEGFRITAEKNSVTIDWSAMTLPEKAEGEGIYLVVADMANDYLNYYPAETEEKRFSMLLTPGRVYVAGIAAFSESPSTLPEQYDVIVVPEAKKLTDYGFRPTLTAVAEMPEGADEEQAPDPVTEVTEELLRSGRAYFYSASAYEVEETIEGKTLLVTLTDPEGNNYRYESSWVYGPEYMKEDIWYIPLTGTGLVWSLDRSGYPRGEYTLAYYVDGEIADSVSFELK